MNLRPRRLAAALTAIAASAGLVVSGTPAANADYSKAITIVGTSDVYDSGLMQYLLPKYQAATGATYNYISKGTGDAIAYAQAGTASVLMVHAASLENQFVSQGYSYEKFGRSVFWGDYVLLGPKNADPAGVTANASHDVVTALEDVAKAGAAGNAQFISRGNTAGTPVQEHALWGLSNGVGKCSVTAANGGGAAPSKAGADNAACNGSDLPDWYTKTGLTQGPNVTAANVCNKASGTSNANGNNCYVFTDRGTFQYLQSIGQAQNLRIMVRDNAATARGNQSALVNAFHAYAINPSKVPGGTVSRAGALKFLNWLTSKSGQQAVAGYLSADSPFIPSASPTITLGQVPTKIRKNGLLKFRGRVTNAIPGYPPLAKVNVKLRMITGYGKHRKVRTVKKVRSTRYGFYSVRYRPTKSARYYLYVGPHTKVEISTLNPKFGDLQQAGYSLTLPVKVRR